MLWVALICSALYVAFLSFAELSWYTADYLGYCIGENQIPSSPDCDLFYPIYLPDLIAGIIFVAIFAGALLYIRRTSKIEKQISTAHVSLVDRRQKTGSSCTELQEPVKALK